MKVRQHLWWVLSGVFLLFCIGFVLATYRFGWSSTGFLNKSLWDWLQLLIVPLALAIIALVFQLANSRTERQIAKQRYQNDQDIATNKQREDLLQTYLDRMTALLLDKDLRSSQPDAEVRNVARARTLTVLPQLDSQRKGNLIQFLSESKLMEIISLSGADLSGANLSSANLSGANLNAANIPSADFSNASLSQTDLSGANLSGANLNWADLSGANLSRADLTYAKLSNAKVTKEQLETILIWEGF